MTKEDFVSKWSDIEGFVPEIPNRKQLEEYNQDIQKVLANMRSNGFTTLTRYESYAALKEGKRVAHVRFEIGQFLYMRDMVVYEEHENVFGLYWDVPFGFGWDEGWYIYEGKSIQDEHIEINKKLFEDKEE